MQFRLPEELRPREHAFKQQVGEVLKRGKVECSLHWRRAPDRTRDLKVNMELVALIRERITEISQVLHETQLADPIDILRWPGVVCEADVDAEPLYAAAGDLLGAALGAIDRMRASEGERIGEMLESRCSNIETIAQSIRERRPEVVASALAKQKERIDRLDVDADPGRLEVELALVAQKLDVDEELDRLDSHVAEIRQVLGAGEPVGRRLDFLAQELNREANTLGSKAADAETTRAAVDLKVLIEQMREQIQNVE